MWVIYLTAAPMQNILCKISVTEKLLNRDIKASSRELSFALNWHGEFGVVDIVYSMYGIVC